MIFDTEEKKKNCRSKGEESAPAKSKMVDAFTTVFFKRDNKKKKKKKEVKRKKERTYSLLRDVWESSEINGGLSLGCSSFLDLKKKKRERQTEREENGTERLENKKPFRDRAEWTHSSQEYLMYTYRLFKKPEKKIRYICHACTDDIRMDADVFTYLYGGMLRKGSP